MDPESKEKAIGKTEKNVLVQLEKAQRQTGYVTEEKIKKIARSLDISIGEVYGVATFYSFLSAKPKGRNIIRICQNLPCYVKDAEMIIKSVEDELGIKPGETTEDYRYSFELTNCIGACDMAPAMLVNDDVHGNLTPGKIPLVLEKYD